MRAVVQRVSRASVRVDGEVLGAIGPGLCLLVAATHEDGPGDAQALADKVWNLRILADADGVMNRSLADRRADGDEAAALVISQFTLYGDTRKGRRPSWLAAAPGPVAAPLVDAVADRLEALGATVGRGRFGADMQVELVNDGPVTVILDVPVPKEASK